MEQFVLGIFQEHLAKFIVGFRKEQVNANLLNGKGEISNFELNCAFLNENLAKVTPFIELESVHISKLSFHVTAWSNLKHAPIVIDIQDVTATIVEPLGYLGRDKRRVLQQLSREQLTSLIEQGLYKLRGAYNLFDRILDNATLEIRSVLLKFQPRGKFKTRRTGPWTPPTIVARLRHVKFVMVDEYGEEATPDQVWRHNRHVHGVPHHERTYMIYKRLSLQCSMGLEDPLRPELEPVSLVKEAQAEVHVAFHKRLRDAAIMKVQADVTLMRVEIEVDTEAVPVLAHAMAGIKYCTSKDRAFDDPLVSESVKQEKVEAAAAAQEAKETGDIVNEEQQVVDGEDDDETDAIPEDISESSSESDECASRDESIKEPEAPSRQASSVGSRDRPVIMLPNGLVIHERISLSLSVHQCTVRGTYDENHDGYVQLDAKGLIAEAIWPQVSREKGGYVQASLSFFSLEEKHGQRVRQILSGGTHHDIDKLPLGWGGRARPEKSSDENFPLFEERSIRPDPFGLRHTFPAQAFGLKMTANYVDKVSDPYDEVISVLHEIGVSQVNILLDSDAWSRALRFAMNESGGGFDPRWHSGDWSDLLTPEMLVNQTEVLDLSQYLQPTKELFLDENEMVSSDLMNLTARFMDMEIRVPAAVSKDVRSCDIVMAFSETMLVVSSALPRTFLSGKIGSSIYGDGGKKDALIDFPNDPSDLCYSLEQAEDPSIRQHGSNTEKAISTLRLQLTVRGFAVRISPVIPFCNADEPQQLVEPLEMTMIVCFEGEPPESPESNLIKIVLFISIQIHRLNLNCDFDVIAGALSTLIHHAVVTKATVEVAENVHLSALRSVESAVSDSPSDSSSSDNPTRMSKTLKNRRVLVKRQIARSRETGGLSVSLCMQMAEFGIQLWRQNVPLASPFRASLNHSSMAQADDECIALMKLMVFGMKELEVGAEWSVQASNRRVILKCCLSELKLASCDFEAECRKHVEKVDDGVQGTGHERRHDDFRLVELLTFGLHAHAHRSYAEVASGHHDILFRAEEQLDSSRSLSFSCEVGPPGVAYIRVPEIETLCLLMIEALLMPTGMRVNPFKTNGDLSRGIRFPDRSIGALLCWLIGGSVGEEKRAVPPMTLYEPVSRPTNDGIAVGELDKNVYSALKNLLPARVNSLMLRALVVDILVFVPDISFAADKLEASKWLGMVVHQTTLLGGFFIPEQKAGIESGLEEKIEMTSMLASGGTPWSSFLNQHESGLHFNVRARPSLYAATRKDSICVTTDSLVSDFEIVCSYEPSGFSLSMDDSALMVKNLDDLNSLKDSLLETKNQGRRSLNTLKAVLAGLRKSSVLEKRGHNPDAEGERILLTGDEGVLDSLVQAELSMRHMRNSLVKLRRVSESHFAQLCNKLHRQRKEIDALRLELFTKERDRIGVLSLISAKMTGWLRMGGTHTYGQRISLVTTMWRYFLVLRKSLLIVLSAPGEPKPVDIIFLEGAQLRPLAGGRRKRDVQRGFSIIESSGIVRFFVAENGTDFEKWIRAISRTINSCKYDGASQASGDKSSDQNSAYSQEHSALGDQVPGGIVISENDGQEPIGFGSTEFDEMGPSRSISTPTKRAQLRQRLSSVKASTKNKLGSAVQAARQRGMSAADDEPNQTGFMTESTTISDENKEDTSLSDIGTVTEAHVSTSRSQGQEINFAGSNESMNSSRRMGNRFAAMKAGTRNRLGSALQTAKEKTKAAADHRRRLQQSFDSNEQARHVADDASEIEQVAEDQERNSSTSFESDDIAANSFYSDVPAPSRRSQLKDKFGAAVKSVRRSAAQDSTLRADDDNATRFNLRRRFGDGDAVKLRGIYVARGNPMDDLGVGGLSDEDIELQRIEGYWVNKVVACINTAESLGPFESTDGIDTHSPPPTLNECPQADGSGNDNENVSGHETFSSVTSDQIDTGIPSTPAVPEIQEQFATMFRISFVPDKDSRPEGPCNIVELVRSLSDVFALHTTLSECVSPILASITHKVLTSADSVDCTSGSNAAAQFDLPALDMLRFTGRLLSGLLEASPFGIENSDAYADYQGEVLKDFLNSALECPLPHSGIEAMSRFFEEPNILEKSLLKPTDALTTSLLRPIGDNAEPTNSSSLHLTHEMLACLSSFENDLVRAENQVRRLQSLVESDLRCEEKRSRATSVLATTTTAMTTTTSNPFLEPLLPSKAVENLHDAMHGALMTIMAERDESHAQLIASSVLNMHEIEQERKKVERLNEQLRVTRASMNSLQQSTRGPFFADKRQTPQSPSAMKKMSDVEEQMMQSSDAEMIALCQQLASEISEKTSASLEVIRLKESRKIEKVNERAEKMALQSELKRCRELLAAEELKTSEAKKEALAWKKAYEEAAAQKELPR